jgi:hypothetical protein
MPNGSTNVWRYILVPSIITLAVTFLRLIGEFRQWNEAFFSRAAGGGGAVVGISWLAFIFAFHFAIRLQNDGKVFASKWKALGLALLALVIMIGGMALILGRNEFKFTWLSAAGIAVLILALLVMRAAWPAYFSVQFWYALAARIPVILVMYFAIRGNWNTHYDALPPNAAFSDFTTKFLTMAVFPQLGFWIPFSVIFCGLLGIVTAAIRRRGGASAA